MKKNLALFFGLFLLVRLKAQDGLSWQRLTGNGEGMNDSLSNSLMEYGLLFFFSAVLAVWILYAAGLWGMLKEVWGSGQQKTPVSTTRRYALPVHEGSRTDLSGFNIDFHGSRLQAAGHSDDPGAGARDERKEEKQRGE